MSLNIKMGIGYDIHRMISGRRLVLGGVDIPFDKGPDAHSDGDVLLHAVMDALFGASGQGDIGKHFPNTDPRYRNAKSIELLRQVVEPLRQREWLVTNLDTTVIAESPRLGPYIQKMRETIAETLGTELSCVNIKAGTNEGCDAIGRGEAIAAQAVVCLQLIPRVTHPFARS